jgi:hypothetical protein
MRHMIFIRSVGRTAQTKGGPDNDDTSRPDEPASLSGAPKLFDCLSWESDGPMQCPLNQQIRR